MDHYNKLDPEVAELLAILAEECGEVTQRVGKILRHGIRVNPYRQTGDKTDKLNVAFLEEELADLKTITLLLALLKVIDQERIDSLIQPKLNKLRRPDILHHSSILRPYPCIHCGSTERIQKGRNAEEDWVECVDRAACDQQVLKNDEEERKRVSQAILSGDAW